ncbi:cytochrome b N-terminal domain-containing protein [Streptomyces sp. DHE17-7]|uniref:cytochrome b N-terminal domain-containing protein n=1 Tax=Streptomyces sp. DHE17-7 TaxID=2759949 RepID=UPI003FA7C603
MTEVVYDGSHEPLLGLSMSEAYRSTVDIGFEVRGGLLIRQLHHWAALVFLSAIGVHLLRVFFTGAFRRPREANWLIGVTLFALALVEGFAGYSLPDDLLSGTGLRIAQGIMLSIPVVGTYVSMFVFGGELSLWELVPRFIPAIPARPGLVRRSDAPSDQNRTRRVLAWVGTVDRALLSLSHSGRAGDDANGGQSRCPQSDQSPVVLHGLRRPDAARGGGADQPDLGVRPLPADVFLVAARRYVVFWRARSADAPVRRRGVTPSWKSGAACCCRAPCSRCCTPTPSSSAG